MPKFKTKEIQLNKVQDTGPPHLEGFNRMQNSYLLGGYPYRRIALQSRGDWCLEFTGSWDSYVWTLHVVPAVQ